MRPWIRYSLFGAGLVVALAGGAIIAGDELANARMNRRVDVPAHEIALRSDAASIERGRYLFASRGCADCHGAQGGGRTFIDDGNGFVVAGPNLTPAGVTARYGAADWVRAIRHGVKPDGRPLMVMPSEDYNRFTDDDLGALVAFVRQLPHAGGGAAVIELPLPVRVLYGYGLVRDAASKIDHAQPPSTPVPEGVTLEHGRYVATMCIGCHGANLSGGKIPGGPPDWPPAADLHPASAGMAPYADVAAFATMFRTGHRPDGSKIKVMPFEALAKMNDTDVAALHLFLRSLPAAR
jgi:mono/diheme cytochrome c family protein